jgi:hypothetical protein
MALQNPPISGTLGITTHSAHSAGYLDQGIFGTHFVGESLSAGTPIATSASIALDLPA